MDKFCLNQKYDKGSKFVSGDLKKNNQYIVMIKRF